MNRVVLICLILTSFLGMAEDRPRTDFARSFNEHYLKPRSSQSVKAADRMLSLLASNKNIDKGLVDQLRRNFKDLIMAWKSLELSFIAGYYDEDITDLPRYIDTFHRGNEDLGQQLQLILESSDPLSKAMFKTSVKTVNALEILLYSQTSSKKQAKWMLAHPRAVSMIKVIVTQLKVQFEELDSFYKKKEWWGKDPASVVQNLVNSLVDSSYRLHVWRVQEPAGLGRKKSQEPYEYERSGLSSLAIGRILSDYIEIFGTSDKNGLVTLAKKDHQDGMKQVLRRMIHVKKQVDALNPSIRQNSVKSIKQVERELSKLHDDFLKIMIQALSLQDHILDADGD